MARHARRRSLKRAWAATENRRMRRAVVIDDDCSPLENEAVLHTALGPHLGPLKQRRPIPTIDTATRSSCRRARRQCP